MKNHYSHSTSNYAIMPVYFGLKLCPALQLRVLHNSADFYWNNLLFLKLAEKQSPSSIFATRPSLRPTVLFNDMKQKLQRVLTAVVDRTFTACNYSTARCCRGYLINRVLEMSALCFYTMLLVICDAFNVLSATEVFSTYWRYTNKIIIIIIITRQHITGSRTRDLLITSPTP